MTLISKKLELCDINVPVIKNEECAMIPFTKEDMSSIPEKLLGAVKDMVSSIATDETMYLTAHGKFLTKGKTLRRPGPHIDGNYLDGISDWTNGGGNGWKVGQGGRKISSEHHKRSYDKQSGGMLIVSDYSSCKGWEGIFPDKAKEGGDCSHISLPEGEMLKENKVYYTTSQFIHESLPVNKDVYRNMIRITLPENFKYLI